MNLDIRQLLADALPDCGRKGTLNLRVGDGQNLNSLLENCGWRFAPLPAHFKIRDGSNTKEEASRPTRIIPQWAVNMQQLIRKVFASDIGRPLFDKLNHVTSPIIMNEKHVAYPTTQNRVTRSSVTAQHQKEITQQAQPYCKILTPNMILSKIEASGYDTPLEACNDMFQCFLAGYRHYPPGSPHWLNLHNVAHMFICQLRDFNISCNFNGPPSVHQTTDVRIHRHSPRPLSSEPYSQSVDHDVKPKEIRALRRMLKIMSPELQLSLYNEFRDSAVWKISDNPEAILDERQTPADVFHKILAWCAPRVTHNISNKHRKNPDDLGSPAVATSDDVEDPPQSADIYDAWLQSDENNASDSFDNENASIL